MRVLFLLIGVSLLSGCELFLDREMMVRAVKIDAANDEYGCNVRINWEVESGKRATAVSK